MKQTNLSMKVMVAVLVVGVLMYLSIYAAQGWNEPVMTATAYQMSMSVGLSAEGLIVREETVIDRGSSKGFVDLSPTEGELVAAGEPVATVFQDASGLEARNSIRLLAVELEQLNYVRSSGTDGTDTSKLDAAVLDSMVALRSIAATGDLSNLEDCALNLRTMVFKRDYTYTGGDAAEGVSMLIGQKQEELAALSASLSHVATTIYAPVSGVFSAGVDGYEDVVDPAAALEFTPDELRGLLQGSVQAPAGAVGKLITSATWYLAVLLNPEEAKDLTVGKVYPVTFSHDWYGTVDMTLEHAGDKQGDQAVYLFSARTRLADTALLRLQTVDIATKQLTGIRVPRQSLRAFTEEVEDKDTGEVREVNYTGVFTIVGSQAELQRVNVLHTANDFYLVEPVNPTAARRLRPGDAVILNSADIYDGKVVR